MRILFVKLGSIGDIVHTLPALSVVRSEFPDAVIDWVAEESSAEILRDNPLIDELIEVNTRSIRSKRSPDALFSEIKKQAGSIRNRNYDIAFDFQGLLKSAMIAKLSGAKKRYGFDRKNTREPTSRLFLTDSVKIASGISVIQKNIDLVRSALGLAGNDHSFEFPIHTQDVHRDEVDEITARIEGRFALLNPAGGWVTKLWPAENYGYLADRLWSDLRLASIVTVGPGEEELANRVIENSSSGRTVLGRTSLKGFYELAKRASVYVGGDTGPTHIAVAAGAPVVGIFGPTEWWRNGSPNTDDICVGREDIDCRIDCHRRTCSKWICMDISVETVLHAVATRVSVAELSVLEAVV